ncbi:MAG TPA: hypothetical protein VH189_05970 [Rhizomicrobium sp.]|jgi:uncharacterized membrane protein|nr:hypothetical protein [Rhizomicrobium sp.]
MQNLLIGALVLHVLAAVFWAGSTFALARMGGEGGERLFRPQMGAAVVAILTGMVLWGLLHSGPPGVPETLLGIGALSALIAAGVQGVLVGGARRRLAQGGEASAGARRRIARAERIASGLLALTIILMTAVRYV